MYWIEKKSFKYSYVKVIGEVIFVWNKVIIPMTRNDNGKNIFKKPLPPMA